MAVTPRRLRHLASLFLLPEELLAAFQQLAGRRPLLLSLLEPTVAVVCLAASMVYQDVRSQELAAQEFLEA